MKKYSVLFVYYRFIYNMITISVFAQSFNTTTPASPVIDIQPTGFPAVKLSRSKESEISVGLKSIPEIKNRAYIPSMPQRGLFLPLDKLYVTSGYGSRINPLTHRLSSHNGVDLRALFVPVYSIASGIVKETSYDIDAGNFIIISYPSNISASYCHLSLILVKPGQRVNAGQVIGISGATGEVTGPHLHFVLRVNGMCVNPLPVLLAIQELHNQLGEAQN